MKKLVLNLTFIIASTVLFAQSFAPLGSTWHYSTKNNMQDSLRWIKIETVADTLFAGKNAKQFSFSFESVNALPCPSNVDTTLMAQHNDSLFFYEYGQWQLLVDFNASVSDTFDYHIAFSNGNQTAVDTIKVRVDSVRQVNYNGQALQSLYLNQTNSTASYDFHDGWITEVIGHEYAPIPWVFSSCSFASAYIYGRRCYSDSIIGSIQFEPYACQSVTTGIGKNKFSDLNTSLSPNPTKGLIYLETSAELQRIEIYNLQGQKVQEVNPNKRSCELPEQSGLYLIRLQDEEGNVYMKKIIKN
jgi:hypothetical protein